MNKTARFKVNAAIKDMVGRGLIYDDNIAIIELIKNSKDAYSNKVEIEFKNQEIISSNSTLIIRDCGIGMSEDDLVNKWLNMAYSEKRGTLNKNNEVYAGNKGVGRFSCDRLGKQLILYTKTQDSLPIKMYIDWEVFENKGQNDEISSIELEYETISQQKFEEESGLIDINSGTCLIIKNLRAIWNDNSINKLKKELEKFISDPNSTFKVYLNGEEIKNNIFDKLSFKTTHIKSSISLDGSIISTTLYYQNNVIYSYKAKNIYPNLKNIDVEVHFLDMFGKTYFKKQTGRSVIEYGSVLLFYNGYRISPYGNEGDDWLGINRRKLQGTRRFFGTRDIIGKVSINNDMNSFQVLTSREGLVHNNAYNELTCADKENMLVLPNGKKVYGYVINLILQLENFVVNGADWDKLIDKNDKYRTTIISEKEIKENPEDYTVKTLSIDEINTAINRIYKRKDFEFIEFTIDKQTINSINDIARKKYAEYIDKIVGKYGNKKMTDLSAHEKSSVRKVIEMQQEKITKAETERVFAEQERDIAEDAREQAEIKANIAEKKVEKQIEENLFLKSVAPRDSEHLLNLIHKINDDVDNLKQTINNYWDDRRRGRNLSREDFDKLIDKFHRKILEIGKIADFATYRNYRMATERKEIKLIEFINNYVNWLIEEQIHYPKIEIHNECNTDCDCSFKVKPINITILIDNIISNAKKHQAKNIYIRTLRSNDILYIKFYNDGKKLSSIYNSNDVFEKGFTTTKGSGLGLYHNKLIIEEEFAKRGSIVATFGDNLEGFEIEVRIKCN